MIQQLLQLIKDQIGLDLTLCDYFTGINYTAEGEKYVNVILPQRLSESADFLALERFAHTYQLIRIEPNGLFRLAIFF